MIARFTRKDFLEALFSQYYKEHRGFILVKSVKRGDSKLSTRYFPNIDILAKEHYGEERDVYFGVCPRERMKAEKEHIHYIVALWADLDIGAEGHEDKKVYFEGPQQAAKAIRSFPRAPSIIVESGRGAHLYWLLKQVTEVTDPERIEKILKNISDHLNCDTDVNLDTVLRLPETVNTKIPGKPVNCDVKFVNVNFRYSLQDFENLGQKPAVLFQHSRPTIPTAVPAGDMVAKPLDESVESRYQPTSPGGDSLDDSLVLDETIIDELIDDISMSASMVADLPAAAEKVYESGQIRPVTASTVPPTPLRAGNILSGLTSSVLDRLSSSRTEVEILLMGSETTINGVLIWNENGLVGIQSGDDIYTIPLTSISYIKTKVI